MVLSSPIEIWRNRARIRYRCDGCAELHRGLPEPVYDSPDAYQALSETDRARRALLTEDFCIIDGRRYYVRGMLYAPVLGTDECFGWSVWVELAWPEFKVCWEMFREDDCSGVPVMRARLANNVRGYGRTAGLACRITLQSEGDRPVIAITGRRHQLACHCSDGIPPEQVVAQALSSGVRFLMA